MPNKINKKWYMLKTLTKCFRSQKPVYSQPNNNSNLLLYGWQQMVFLLPKHMVQLNLNSNLNVTKLSRTKSLLLMRFQ